MSIATKTKRRIYIFLAIILGIMLGVIGYAFFDKKYIIDNLASGELIELPRNVLYIFLAAGAALGYVLGVRWWQIVYVEKRHWRAGRKG